jgi:hypothetical protein
MRQGLRDEWFRLMHKSSATSNLRIINSSSVVHSKHRCSQELGRPRADSKILKDDGILH